MNKTDVMKSKRVTRDDVAKRAGVSPAVVSYVMNKSKYVSPELTKAVQDAVRELHYQPTMQARGLKTNRSMQIAFVCDNLQNDWMAITERKLFEKGYYVSHCYSRDSEDFVQMLIARRFDAVFMMSNRFRTAQLNEIAQAGIPIVLYRTRKYGDLDPDIATVVPDYKDGVKKTVNYLAMKGHRRIALIPPIRYRTDGLLDDGFRVSAYCEALKQNGLELDERLICKETESLETILTSISNMLIGFGKDERPTALITGSDYMAVRIIGYLKKMGLRVPEDVAVVGVDNTYLSTATTPALTTIDFSKQQFSESLSEALLKLIDGAKVKDQYIPVSIVIRDSA